MSASIRDRLVEELSKLLGPDVHVIPYQDGTDLLERRTVMVKQQTISRLPGAPTSTLRIDYILTFISSAIGAAAAEADLDQWVPQTLSDLTASWIAWESADKVLFGATNYAYDVRAYALTTSTNEAPEEE